MSDMISIIVPVYNTLDCLERCFTSIKSQTYENFEVVIVDDGSTDGSSEVCDRWSQIDSRFKSYHQNNAGQAAARNFGVCAAKGDFLAFVDSDDYISEDYLKDLFDALKTNDADISICAHYEDRDGIENVKGPQKKRVYDRIGALIEIINDDTIQSYCWGRIYKKSLFNGVVFPVGRNYEDLAVNYRLFDNAKTLCTINRPLYHYVIRKGSMSFNDGTAVGWHDKCHSNVLSQIERTEYFKTKQEYDLVSRSLAALLPYLYSDIMTGCNVGNMKDTSECRDFLKNNKKNIMKNVYVRVKDKFLYFIYCSDGIAFRILKKMKEHGRSVSA